MTNIKENLGYIRYIASKIPIHPAWNKDNRQVLIDTFDLDPEDVDMLHEFFTWIMNHELEYLYGKL